MYKLKAFTLAEVLITLGIIGVVSAIIIPMLMTNYKAHVFRSRFLKTYSLLTQTLKIAQEDDVYLLENVGYASENRYQMRDVFKRYLVGSVDCDNPRNSRLKSCLRITYGKKDDYKYGYKTLYSKDIDLTNQGLFDDGELLLSDGTLIFFNADSQMVGLHVDINGVQFPPNRWGYDLFTFQLIDGYLVPMGNSGTKYTDINLYCSLNGSNNLNGIACTTMAVSDTDYFKRVVKNIK